MAEQIHDVTRFSRKIVVTSPEKSALEHLSDNTTLSKEKIKQAMTNGAVWLESSTGIHRVRRAKKTLSVNDILHIYYDQSIQNSKPEQAELISDMDQYSIWNKPCGMYSQGTKWGDHCTIHRWAETYLKPQRPAFIVHRLDRHTKGLIMIAHSKKIATELSELFRDRKIIKRYRATVAGEPELTLPYTIAEDIDSKPARSTIIASKVSQHGDTVFTIEIESGRKHQIRKHLASIAHPVIGDRLYGAITDTKNHETETRQLQDLQLQSCYLAFTCPVTGTEKIFTIDE